MTVVCRKATEDDVESLHALIGEYAEKGIMLPRSREALRKYIDTFVVAEMDGRFVGCGSLFRLGQDLVEIRSLGMVEGYKGLGIGRKLVEFLETEATNLKVRKIMALTYEVGFFEKIGYKVVSKDIFPEKVWLDCIFCSKRHACDEIAVMKILDIP